MKKNLLDKIKSMDDNEKHFFLLALAFILITSFLLFQETFYADDNLTPPEIVLGDSGNNTIDDIQKHVCIKAEENNRCSDIDDSYIVTRDSCCESEGICCG